MDESINMEEQVQTKPSIHFFTIKAKKQTKTLTAALPFFKPFIEEFRRISRMQNNGEKAKALKLAQQELITAEAVLLNKKDNQEAQEAAIRARVVASNAFDEAKAEESEIGMNILESVIENAVLEYYENVLNILALFTNTPTDVLEDEYDVFELGEMLVEIVENKKVANFLSRLRLFKSKMQFGILGAQG